VVLDVPLHMRSLAGALGSERTVEIAVVQGVDNQAQLPRCW
jgi:hypothetical protein